MAGRAPAPSPRHRSLAVTVARNGDPCFAVVASRFNEPITKRLVAGALQAFARAGLSDSSAEVHWVPGSFELPQAARYLAETGRYAGIVCVGVVIRGQTPHFDYVAREAAAGIQHVALTTGVPVSFGVVTALTEEQALARSGGDVGNRGEEAADAVLAMAEFVQRLRSRPSRRERSGRRPSHGQAAKG